MNLLITGSSGYLGGRLTQYLAGQPHYSLFLGSRTKIEPFPWCNQAKTVEINWRSETSLNEACTNINVVVHLAGMNAQECKANPATALEVNSVFTARLLQAAIEKGVQRFIHLSTAHVYAAPLVGNITEETCLTNLHPYATSHQAGEDVVRFAHQRGEIEGIVVRLSNAFGMPMDKTANCWMLLVNDLCRQVVMGQQMKLYSSGLQRRDFIPLQDACAAIKHLLELSPEKLGNGVYNVGGKAMRVIDMAELIRIRSKVVLGSIPEMFWPKNGATERLPDLHYSSMKLLSTGFSPGEKIEEEIDNTLKMCQKLWG